MDKANKLLTSIVIILLFFVGVLAYVFTSTKDVPVGSVNRASEYHSTNLKDITGSSTTGTLIKTGAGTIGSLVLATTAAQSITIYDVASAANYASTTLSTKVITFATSTAAGTYTIDRAIEKGLVIYAPVTPTAESIITWR